MDQKIITPDKFDQYTLYDMSNASILLAAMGISEADEIALDAFGESLSVSVSQIIDMRAKTNVQLLYVELRLAIALAWHALDNIEMASADSGHDMLAEARKMVADAMEMAKAEQEATGGDAR